MAVNYWTNDNIRIRAMEDKDLDMYIETRSNPDSMRQFYEDRISPPFSCDDIKKEYKRKLKYFSKEDKKIFVIETLEQEYIGEICVWFTDQLHRYFRYGIFVDEKWRGKGYSKQALIIVLDYYFNELNYNKCSPTVYSYNQFSQRFHEKFGFILEGKLRNEVYARGKYHDMYHYGMLKSEFNSLYQHFV